MKVSAGCQSQEKKMSLGHTFKKSSGKKKVMGSSSKERQQDVFWDRCELENRAGTGSWISGGITGRQPHEGLLQARNMAYREEIGNRHRRQQGTRKSRFWLLAMGLLCREGAGPEPGLSATFRPQGKYDRQPPRLSCARGLKACWEVTGFSNSSGTEL